jgi:hypothetical protein
MSELPPEALRDCFRPPDVPVEVHCIHCGREYDSYLIWWDEEIVDGERSGFWRCPTPGCGGAGFGFDIWPTDPDYVDPRTGEKMCFFFDEDDDEACDEDEGGFEIDPQDEFSPSDDAGWDDESVPW